MTSALERPHVLIVSADPDLTAFLGEGLIYAGFWTSVIADALQALEVFRLRSFDIILLDAALGGIGALEFVQRLRGRSDRATGDVRSDIPLVLIAAESNEIPPEIQQHGDPAATLLAPVELPEIASTLLATVTTWRRSHPDRAWADAAALGDPN
ncbi:MAG: response regulator transcription factor [Thermomicrobiales bacterium]|nr:response regulator transcription factor [Thermomicrobiales bacterium]MCA9877854.1 response regulator transcription factor [Thermomicrobiales bacterium]